jgi:hypothetical protein
MAGVWLAQRERTSDIDDGEGRMSVKQCLFRLWIKLTVLSVLVDIACFWLVDHTPAAVPGSAGPNYIAILLVSAPTPIVLAVVLTLVGLFCSLSGWVWKKLRLAWRQPVLAPSATAHRVRYP